MLRRVSDPRAIVIASLVLSGSVGVALHGRIPQDPHYHAFADQRSLFGIARFADTVSSLPFAAVGIAGVLFLRRTSFPGELASLRPAYATFFAASVLIAAGSAYYHLDPSNARLFWDRLPMTIAFMAFLTIVVGESIGVRIARRLHVPLMILGALSVVYWRWSDTGDGGDLRPYVLVQYLPMVIVPAMMLMYPSRLEPAGYLWAALGAYGLAVALELLDRPIFDATQTVSGHTLKHLAAALSVFLVLVVLEERRPSSTASGSIPRARNGSADGEGGIR